MKIPGKNKAARAGTRLSTPLLIVLLVMVASVLIIYSTPVLTEEKRTGGNLTFTDSAGIPVSGTIEISMTGAPSGGRSNVNSITWRNAPNAWIYFDAHETKSVSINLRISGDSPNGMVSLEDHGAAVPGSVGVPVPGVPVKYVELHSTGVSFAEADISIYYTDAELKGLDETSLVIYGYDGGAWTELPIIVDAAKNVVSAAVVTLSFFAVSARASERIEIRDTGGMPVTSEVRTYDEARTLKKQEKTSTLSSANIPDGGELEVDAMKTKNVSVRLRMSRADGGSIILDNYGRKNPVSLPLPGKALKFVEIGASNVAFIHADITIQYSDAELGDQDENRLVIYHYKNGAWSELSTGVDAANNTVTASTDSLSVFAVSATGGMPVLRLATNRYVILDDPKTGTTSPGFPNPLHPWTDDNWVGETTTIRAYALVLNESGLPQSGINITFSLKYPNGTQLNAETKPTPSNGTVSYFYDLNNVLYYGNWTIWANATANATNVNKSTRFIYNWWGCANCHGGPLGVMYDPSKNGTVTPNSPYMEGYDKMHTVSKGVTSHRDKVLSRDCIYCHRSYGSGAAPNQYPPDYHNSKKTCQDCHNYNFGTETNGIPDMRSCNNASCHVTGTSQRNKNLTQPSTLNSSSTDTDGHARTKYSDTVPNASGSPLKYHDADASVPCIICHNSMHKTTKPDPSVLITSNITEYTQCTSCHNAYNRHNNTVNCTVCHSQDAHVIKVFAQNATYINGSTSSFRGNCTSCHQNSTFMNALLVQPKAGSYTGSAPQGANPVKHSNDESAGSKWKSYWTAGDQLSSCKYCHGETLHKTSALGRPSLWKGNNTVNSTIGNTTWCSSCHWQGYANGTNAYSDMVSTFTEDSLSVPPEISGNASYGANQSIYEYTNHSLYTSFYSNLNDSTCNRCHGYNYGFTTITRLVHNQTRVGGANCVDCHDLGGIALVAHVNVTATYDNNEIHKDLNSGVYVNGTAYYANNKRCWACHANASEPTEPNAHYSNSAFNYKTPYNCENCHIIQYAHNTQLTLEAKCTVCHNTILNISQHFRNGTSIRTPAAASCYACHNKSEMLIPAYDRDNGSGAVYGGLNGGNNSASHYGKKRADLRIGISTNCSYCHQNTSTVFVTAMLDPSYNSSISNHSLRYSPSNPSCTQCHSTGFLHNSTLTKPALTLPNSVYCLSCHGNNGSGGTNCSGAVTGVKAKHNNTVYCTECHLNNSKDIHPVKYLQQNATYDTGNSTVVDCTTCHQTSSVDSKLTLPPPKIPMPLHHSDNASNGTRWNSTAYWTPASPLTACIYCHNDTKHNVTALGRPANWKGNNIVNSSLGTGTWCASCHYRNYSSGGKNYSNMTHVFTSANLSVPPEITNGSYAVNIYNRSNYYNHSLKDYSDAVCRLCHGVNLSSSTTISAFLHNMTWGSCTGCHYSFQAMNNTTRPDRYVDFSMYNTSLHRSLSCTNCHTQGHRNIGARKTCEDCHAVQANPITDRDRHNITPTPSTYSIGGNNVVGITDCTVCHDSDLYNRSISTYGYWKPKDCDYCHTYPDKYYE